MLGLGLFDLASKGFWQDEGYTWSAATLANGKFLHLLLSTEANGGIYLVFQHLWVQAGTATWWLRLPSVLFATAVVPTLWVLTRRLFDARTATIATALLVVNGAFLSRVQEARTYPFVLLLACASMYWFVREMDAPGRGNRVWWVVTSVLLVLAHVAAAPVLVAQVVSLAVARPDRERRRHVLIGVAVIAVVTLPFALLVRSQPGYIELNRSIRFFASGIRHVVGGGNLVLGIEAIAAIAVVVLCVSMLRADGRSDAAWRLALPALWFGLSVVLLLVYTQLALAFADRYVLAFLPGLLIVVAVGINRIPARWVRVVVLVVIFAVLAQGVWRWYDDGSLEGWREMAAVVERDAKPGDAIVFALDAERIPFSYYLRDQPRTQRELTPAWPGTRDWKTGFHTGDDHYVAVSAAKMGEIAATQDRIWLVDPGFMDDDLRPALRELRKTHRPVLERHFDGSPYLQLWVRR